jgi:cobalt-zinc-cadmium efflux system protein
VNHPHPTRRQLLAAVVLTSLLTLSEVIGGWESGSLALWGEAAHFVSDGWAFAVAFYALSHRPSETLSYGRGQMLALGSFVNALLQGAIGGVIFWQSVRHLQNPEAIEGGLMLVIAAAGVLVNGLFLRVFGGLHLHTDTAIEGTRIHFLADLALCAGTLLAALLVHLAGWTWADPVLAGLAALLMLATSFQLARRSGHILLSGVPREIDLQGLTGDLLSLPGVRGFHDLHVWQVGHRKMASVHVFAPALSARQALERVNQVFAGCGVDHVTIQMEDQPCAMPCQPLTTPGSFVKRQ